MKQIYCLMIMLCPLMSKGQLTSLQPLGIGDRMPPITLLKVMHYTTSEIKTEDLNNKLVLIDFMTTGCIACIKAMPRLDSLQKEFEGKLQVLMVTPESERQVSSFLKRKNIAPLNLAVIAEDTVLAQLFPHTYIPHEILVRNDTVISITYPEYITEANISAILAGDKLQLPVKRDIDNFSYQHPLLHLNETTIPDFSYPASVMYSALTSYMDNVPERFTTVIDTVRGIRRISMVNVPVVDLYMRALYGPRLQPAFIQLGMADKSRYAYIRGKPVSREWLQKNAWCYEASFATSLPIEAITRKINEDLDFYLQLHGRLEKRVMPCWVISANSTLTVTARDIAVSPTQGAGSSLESIIYSLNNNYGNIPVIDESGLGNMILKKISGAEDISVPLLQEMLKCHGLQIKFTDRLLTILVITDKQSKYTSNQTK
ncbi:TlpA family protein disulfide reductase [Ginsengibacter hankyongi]|uniref:TlpA family protein disulfide reductase n=1 Tax=Ginsengibacter hankyongi TaxID=2607284 RepID=A0A5J5IFD4_9BACT|nr:TlpA disulfide reductase family protein [Ginsengibacter hankyongi]KAA9038738.1 TlpA family protein disulfide reductase [Ginsengibacter hankyongi]